MDSLAERLPPRQRLALAYARKPLRAAWLFILALDATLGATLRAAREPMLVQIRLAWWREQVASGSSPFRDREPLLALQSGWPGDAARLVALVDAWEGVSAPAPLPAGAMADLADARARVMAAVAADDPASLAMARAWSLADLAAHLGDAGERETALALAQAADWQARRLPVGMRPLAVLHALALRDMRQNRFAAGVTPAGLLTAIRVGMVGW